MKKLFTALLSSLSIAVSAQEAPHLTKVWGDIDSDIAPWVQNLSRPNNIKKGLAGRHIALWASHGRYYDQDKDAWKWQRPNLFSTTEDLFTQTIVVPYLIPMLENAGAYVFTPRERDWQKHEVIVDNDGCWPKGSITTDYQHKADLVTGFKFHTGNYHDGENPFEAGTALVVKAEKHSKASVFTYYPEITDEGRYAVYVSYPKLEDAVDDVTYTVYHKGEKTSFRVNQQIGHGTWVYLGSFLFGATDTEHQHASNCVTVSTASEHKGHIGTDAIRFGGGMGNIERGGYVSGFPRCLEGARYSAQWAGAPYNVYSDKMGVNDYGDDINVRSLMTNWVGGGSCYMPQTDGLGVPLELSLAIHSDAGYNEDGKSIHGSLAIATTNYNDGLLAAGISRATSLDFAERLRDNLDTDMREVFGKWNRRFLWDRNYSETRLPNVPSAIIETLSHQSFPDMAIGQHPMGKFAIARSIYKTIVRYICEQHGEKCMIAPLAPRGFAISLKDANKVQLEWLPTYDSSEPMAVPTSYNIYTSIDDGDFDNGQNFSGTSAVMKLQPGLVYNFRITACNDGGESFPTETLSAYIAPKNEGTVIVVNGFERLAAPYIIDTETSQGFDLTTDEGVQRGLYAGWSGQQLIFNKETMGQMHELGLGYSASDMAGEFVAGNDFNYVADHTKAIAAVGRHSVVSCSLTAINEGIADFAPYHLVDLAFGLQKDDGQLGLHFKTFTPKMRQELTAHTARGGALLVSGSFLGSDMLEKDEQDFLSHLLKVRYQASPSPQITEQISGLGMTYDFYHYLNDRHYAATHPEILSPVGDAICAMQYSDGTSAAVGYRGRYTAFTMGYPLECIKDATVKRKVMQGLLVYLMKK